MRKDVFVLLYLAVFLVSSCTGNAGKTNINESVAATENSAPRANDFVPPATDSPTNATPSAPSETNAAKSPKVANSDGQNTTYSTAGELEIVGSEIQYDIILPSDILFDFDKHQLRSEAGDLLAKLKAHFTNLKTNQVHIFGHTDSKGDEQYNAVLSQKRAVTVQKWLKENTDIYAMALGMGEREPLVPNENPDGSDNPENRQRNRRVTIRVALQPDVNKMLNRK